MSGEYPPNWKEIATEIKKRARWHCARCFEVNDKASGHVLTVHHLDGDKSNCAWWNLPPLCQRCHLKIQARVDMKQLYMFGHTDWMIPFLVGERMKDTDLTRDNIIDACHYWRTDFWHKASHFKQYEGCADRLAGVLSEMLSEMTK